MTESSKDSGKPEPFQIHVMERVASSGPTPTGAPGEMLDLQSGGLLGIFFRDKEVPADSLLNSWENTQKALTQMLASARTQEKKGMRLEELEVNLSISGEGNVVFVGAKAEASVVLKFKRS